MWKHAAVLLIFALGCTEGTPVTPGAEAPFASPAVGPSGRPPVELAKMVAQTLKNPAFRAYLKAQLDASPYAEHKLEFQTFVSANDGRALRQIAAENALSKDVALEQANKAIALEVYFPVPAHRDRWTGDEHVLVATALNDRDAPVAFDPHGRSQILDPDTPPDTPVLALVPVETDFLVRPATADECPDCGGGGGGWTGGGDEPPPPPPPAPGLYMTKSHFVQDFEGWLKGSPEFEVHILGQKSQTDSLTDYQCAGEHAGGPYAFDQNKLDWSGNVLLFSKSQIDQYNAAHPNQNMRVFVVEDDDAACEVRTDPDRFQKLIAAVDSAYGRLTTGNESGPITKYWGYARAIYNVWQALASFFKSNDELIGNAVEDDIVDAFYPGYNWIVKGDNNITNGWINLELR
jgi:hypothetical protein